MAESVPEIKLEPSPSMSSARRNHQNPSASTYQPSQNVDMRVPVSMDFLRPNTSEKYPVGISKSTTPIAKQAWMINIS